MSLCRSNSAAETQRAQRKPKIQSITTEFAEEAQRLRRRPKGSRLRFPPWRGGEGGNGMDFAKDLHDFALKSAPGGGRRSEFSSHDPGAQLFPVLGIHGPTFVPDPFALFGGVPIAFVFSAQASLLARDPLRMFAPAGTAELDQARIAALAIDAKAAGNCVGRETDIELAARAVWFRKIKIHLRAIGRFVAGEADIAVDAREVRADAAADHDLRIQFLRRGSQPVEQHAERFNDHGAIAFAVFVHPGFAVIAAKLAEEAENFR